MNISNKFKQVFIASLASVMIFIISGVFLFSNVAKAPELKDPDKTVVESQKDKKISDEKSNLDDSLSGVDSFEGLGYTMSATLNDVTAKKTIQGVNFNGKAAGKVEAGFIDKSYKLYARFGNLPEPTGGAFYEGWLVNKDTNSVISTGKAKYIDGKFVNTYTSTKDLSDHKFYVLTLEPDDSNPKPADHILEGNF
ncbi:hypothetical protein KBB17_03090 [Candidatus Saccharibacteria bacterium]|jgi:hypothetical protein|nr:hypothetical protein [Candidatus Saccharibacteria bacterium]MBP9131987.1 hypothetical protein [Candidatus Saccharibacteria bacterium]